MADTLSSEPHYYVNNASDTCRYGTTELVASENRLNGGLCAYIPSVPNTVWACPAPDAVCWTTNHWCTGPGLNNTPGPGQISCTEQGIFWCCLDGWENCAATPGQTFACWAATGVLGNPLKGLEPSVAVESASQIVEQFGLIFSSPTPVPVTAVETGTGSTESDGSVVTVTQMPSVSTSPTPPSLSVGAVVGIAIGALAAVALLILGVFVLFARERRKWIANELGGHSEKPCCKHEIGAEGMILEAPESSLKELPDLVNELESPGLELASTKQLDAQEGCVRKGDASSSSSS